MGWNVLTNVVQKHKSYLLTKYSIVMECFSDDLWSWVVTCLNCVFWQAETGVLHRPAQTEDRPQHLGSRPRAPTGV